jgi:ribosomal protein S18 acetylase RimI-like enzyme
MQKLGIGSKLVDLVEAKAQQDGKREIACDTAEGANSLIDYYIKRGYRSVGYHRWSHASYRSIVLSKTVKINSGQI